jgi:hypothetical protein
VVLGGLKVEPGCGCGARGGEGGRGEGSVTARPRVESHREWVGTRTAGQRTGGLLVQERAPGRARGCFECLSDHLVAELEPAPSLDDEPRLRSNFEVSEHVDDRPGADLGHEFQVARRAEHGRDPQCAAHVLAQ